MTSSFYDWLVSAERKTPGTAVQYASALSAFEKHALRKGVSLDPFPAAEASLYATQLSKSRAELFKTALKARERWRANTPRLRIEVEVVEPAPQASDPDFEAI